MTDTSKIREHMDVVCSCGTRIGAVDHVDGNRIKLTKSDPSAGGQHHWVPLDWVENIDGNRVMLNKNSEEAKAGWNSEGCATGQACDMSQGDQSQQGKSQPARGQSGSRSAPMSQQDSKTSPQGDTASAAGGPAKAGTSRGRATNDQQGSDTQPRM